MGTLYQGYRELAQDDNIYSFDSTLDLVPTGTGFAYLNYGINIINYSGAVTAVLPSGIELNNPVIYVKDGYGHASGLNITISGSTGQTIDGASTYVINTNYGHVRIINWNNSGTSAQPWYTI